MLEKQGKTDDARAWYERAVREYPLSVYALLSLTRLKAPNPARARRRWSRRCARACTTSRPGRSRRARCTATPGFLRAVELARMGQGGDARRELAKLGLATSAEKHVDRARRRGEEEDLVWITATLLDRGGVWSASHSLPRYGVTQLQARVPEGARRGEVEARLPARLPGAGRQEHQGQPAARGAAAGDHARGERVLAAHRIVRERHRPDADAGQDRQAVRRTAPRSRASVLLDPAKNVEIGSRFLGFLWKHFDAAAPLAIAGYNAGEAAVDRWLGERGDLAMDEFMETIPYDETRNYTKRVLASYFTYSWLYGKQPVPTVPLGGPWRRPATRRRCRRRRRRREAEPLGSQRLLPSLRRHASS